MTAGDCSQSIHKLLIVKTVCTLTQPLWALLDVTHVRSQNLFAVQSGTHSILSGRQTLQALLALTRVLYCFLEHTHYKALADSIKVRSATQRKLATSGSVQALHEFSYSDSSLENSRLLNVTLCHSANSSSRFSGW